MGRKFFEQELEGMDTFIFTGANGRLAVEDYALILGGELAGLQVYIPNNTKRHTVMALEDVYFLALGRTMDVDGIVTIPHKVKWHAIGLTIQIYHRQNAVFGTGKDFSSPCFVEQTVLSSDFTIFVLQIE